jgi:thermitase
MQQLIRAFLPRGLRNVLALSAAGSVLFVAAACSDLSPTDPAQPSSAVLSGNPEIPEYVAGQVLVRFRPGAARNEIAQQNRARPKEELLMERVWILEVEEGEELEVANNLRMNPNVEFAEPNFIYRVVPCETGDCTLPNDPNFGAKWDLHNTGFITDATGTVVAQTGQQGADIAWLEAKEYLENNGGVSGSAVIAIIDTGIRATHQDLAGKVIGGRNFFPPNCILIFCWGTPVPGNWADDQGHGTHVAGIAAARANNGLGVPGVAYMDDVKLLAVRVCGTSLGICNAAAITNGIVWAADNGAHVLNLSLGGAASAATQSALQHAVSRGVLPICASGNDGSGSVSFPAAYPECMAVGSTGWGDTRASYSNFGPQIEVTAPGGDVGLAPHSYILSSHHASNTAYAYMAGTSMAAPQAAGLAGLLRASGITSAAEIRDRMRSTADDLGAPGFDNQYGHGRINVYRALTQMDPFIEMRITTRSTVNLGANGNMQVVLLDREAETFGLDMLRIETIRIGNTHLAQRPNGSPFATWSDVDGDGRPDLVLHFSIPALRTAGDLTAGSTEVVLHGTLTDGRRIRAFVDVRVL